MKGEPRGVIVRGETFYHNDTGARRSITKPRKYSSNILPEPITASPRVKKIEDVDNLLTKHFGKEWRQREDLNYYRQLRNNADADTNDDNVEEALLCEEYAEEPCDLTEKDILHGLNDSEYKSISEDDPFEDIETDNKACLITRGIFKFFL
ncbi:unnamed protein product [Parnassius apollo]|uniref:(apollo) hypothetical protein n=1 Tax=Parnassius apollo TaxID=110799 RepID=A0A8S3XEB6_PARAO|nr:unnamed protein product [Parnassius apollo]